MRSPKLYLATIIVVLATLFIGAQFLQPIMLSKYKESCINGGSTWDTDKQVCIIRLKK